MDRNWSRPGSLEEFGGWLRRRREELRLTLDDVAGKTGISKPYLSNIETARAPGPPSEGKLRLLAEVLGLGAQMLVMAGDWLRTPESVRRMVGEGGVPRRADGAVDLDAAMGKGAKGRKERKYTPHAQGPFPEHGTREIGLREVPVINRVAAGKASEFGDMNYPAGVADEYVPAPDLPGAPVKSAFALRITGDSMIPAYEEGEMIIVGPGDAVDGDDCVVRLGEGENYANTFKRVFFVRDAEGEVVRVRLVALNKRYAERVVGVEEVTGIYPVMYRMLAVKRGSAERPAPSETAGFEGKGEEREMTQRVSIEHD